MTITDKTIAELQKLLADGSPRNAAFAVAAVNAMPTLLARIAELEAALREIEPAALYHPQHVWPDELKAIIRAIVGIARKALNKESAT